MEPRELFALLDSAGDAAFTADLTGEICHWSPRAEELLGFSATQVFGRPCAEVVAGRDEHANEICRAGCKTLELARTGGAIPTFDLHAATIWGKRKWLSVSTIVVPVKKNTLPLVVHLMRDIDPRKRIENATRDILVQIGHLTGQDADRIVGSALPDPPGHLTAREIFVLKYLAQGLNTAEIAERLGITRVTVRNHIQHVLDKLSCHTRLDAVMTGVKRGLI